MQDNDPVAQLLDFRQQVGGKNDGMSFAQLADQFSDFPHLLGVEANGGFVQHQHVRVAA